ncbi:MAG: hypothetical protein JEY94_07675 [Melioribacteraceae bacterium]|nr:hypothetical protein [Melioribacteraceae bacterium]
MKNLIININYIIKNKSKTKTLLKTTDWFCLQCKNMITSDFNRFLYDGKSEFNFTNPGGAKFNIILFNNASGCFEIGKPTFEFAWFENYKWQFSVCSRCGFHLGWNYSGSNNFYGLIRTSLIKGETLFN